MMPVMITNPAVKVGKPPIFSATPMATGLVTDLGATDSQTSPGAPKEYAIATALPTLTTEPTNSAANMGTINRRIRAKF